MKATRSDNKTLREESTKSIISLLFVNQGILMDVEKTILFEVLCNQKSFSELTEIVNLTTHRQKIIFGKAFEKLSSHVKDINRKLSLIENLEREVSELRNWKDLLETNMKAQKEKENKIDPALKKMLSRNIADLQLSERVKSVCRYGDLVTVADLASISRHDLLSLRNCGKKTIGEIEDFMEENGLWWSMDVK